MKESDDHKPFIDRIKAEFDRSVEALDGETASRITRVRHRALERVGKHRPVHVWLPAGAIATLCLALVIYALVPRAPVQEQPALDNDMDLISDLDLYENLEFYEWLEDYELPG